MTLNATREYLEAIHERYKKATKKRKSSILDEFCAVCGVTRKHAIKLINRGLKPPLKRRGPRRKYDDDFVVELVKLWKKMHKMCGKRMAAALPIWLPYYQSPGFTEEHRRLMFEISASSIDRLLKPHRDKSSKGLSATKAGSFLKSQIPIQTLDNEITKPGYIEADTVAHCGDSLTGDFGNSLTMTDLLSGWTANRATWGKKAEAILTCVMEIRSELPFPMKGFACDNGSEFINYRLEKYFREKHPAEVRFTRRRPYKKNDAAHVEQKNDIMVRKIFGYERVSSAFFIPLMNEIYREFWNPLNNHFMPMMKLKKKVRLGAKVHKYYDKPKTPYERLIESGKLSPAKIRKLKLEHEALNPFELKAEMDKKLADFHKTLKKFQITHPFIEETDDAA